MEFEVDQQPNGENVQPQDGGQGDQPENQQEQPQEQQQPIDYEKAYKNLEKDYTKKSQKLSILSKWEEFEKQTGITADQALAQLKKYQGQQSSSQPQQSTQPQNDPSYSPNPYNYQQPVSPYINDPRIVQIEQRMREMEREREIAELKQRFPGQFENVYSDVVNLADAEGIDLKTAFGRVVVENWDTFQSQVQQQVVNNIQHKQQKNVESSTAPEQGGDPVNDLSPEEIEAAKAMGIDPKEYAVAKNMESVEGI